MSNPLSNPSLNKSILKIPISSGNAVQDKDGNWVSNNERSKDYQVFFKTPARQSEANYDPGVDGFSVYLKGYLVEPKFLPANLKMPIKVECIRAIGQREQKGTFELRPSLSPVPLVADIIGQQVEGWFFWN